MAQVTQVKFTTPNNDYNVINNAPAPAATTTNAGAPIGYDTLNNGTDTQGLNSFADTGTVLLDSVNDVAVVDPSAAGVTGNPVLNRTPTPAVLTTVINDATKGIRILFKNPA